MPDLSGMSRAEALNACKEKGLMPTFKTETVPKGQASGVVLRTDPVSGTQVEANTENSSVTVYISQEEVDKSTTVPNLVGVASLSEAQDLIRSAKLVLGGYSEEYSDTVPAGAVISQNPVSGTPPNGTTLYRSLCPRARRSARSMCTSLWMKPTRAALIRCC